MFSSDPSTLRHIPRSEYRKRRDYYLKVQQANRPNVQVGPGGVVIEESDWKPEDGAVIIE